MPIMLVTMTALEKRVQILKSAYLAAHKQAPIALYLTLADEIAMRSEPPSFLCREVAAKVVAGKLRVRKLMSSFMGLQIIWAADRTRVD
jgi:hypothetical protein